MSETRGSLPARIRRRLAAALFRLALPSLPEQNREGMWSIPASFLYVYFGLMAMLCVPPLAVIIAEQAADLPKERWWMTPITLIRLSATEFGPVGLGNAIVSLIITQGGFTVMVLYYHMLNKLVVPVIKRHEARGEALGREEGREEGRKEGQKEGAAQANKKWGAWNQRRMDAEANGLPFDEPPPDQPSDEEEE